MLYPFITEPDGTEIVYSDIFHIENDKTDYVKVLFERVNPITNKFDSMECVLPGGKLSNIIGFSTKDVIKRQHIIDELTPMILECAKEDLEDEHA